MDTSIGLLERLHWLGHASFRLDGPPTIYFDPWRLKGALPQADIVLISHEHFDHCSPQDGSADLLLLFPQGHIGGEKEGSGPQGQGLPEDDDAPQEGDAAQRAGIQAAEALQPQGDVTLGTTHSHRHEATAADHHPFHDRLAAVVKRAGQRLDLRE